jgi:hypothetical protein
MKKICTFSIICLLFSGCDYFASYHFVVTNDTNYKIVIKTSAKVYDNGFYFSDSVHVLKYGNTVEFDQDLGVCGKYYVPEDIYIGEDIIPEISKFDIYADGKLQKTLRLRSNWEYEGRRQVGVYTLRITPECLE